MKSKIRDIYSLEQLSSNNSVIHRLHPMAKLLITVLFIILVVSFGRYDFGRLIPYIFYPTVIMALSDTPYSLLLKRFAVAVPFCLLAGISNIIFDTGIAFVLGDLRVSYGVISFFTILFKAYLSVMAVLILVATTPVIELSQQFRALRVPNIFVSLFEMTYRYIGTLFDETSTMYTSYILRSGGKKGIEMHHMGSFVGQLLLRSFDRAERIFSAMKCRGYALRETLMKNAPLAHRDWLYLSGISALFLLIRFVNISAAFTNLINGVL